MNRGLPRARQNITTTDSLTADKGFRCMTCGQFAAVAVADPYGRTQCIPCRGKDDGLIELVDEEIDMEMPRK